MEEALSQEEADRCRKLINDTQTQPNSYYDDWFVEHEDEGTTHVSVIDEEGNAVAATDTIDWAYVE